MRHNATPTTPRTPRPRGMVWQPPAGPPAPKRYVKGWYFFKTAQGSIGVVNHTTSGPIALGNGEAVTTAVFLASSNATLIDIQTISSTYRNLVGAMSRYGTPNQESALIEQLDLAAGKNPRTKQIVIPLSGPTTASTGKQPVSTTPSGDAASAAPLGGAADSLAQAVSDAIQTPLDFLKFIGWLFHPLNILRLVEFNSGMALIIIGLWVTVRTRRGGRRFTSAVRRVVVK